MVFSPLPKKSSGIYLPGHLWLLSSAVADYLETLPAPYTTLSFPSIVLSMQRAYLIYKTLPNGHHGAMNNRSIFAHHGSFFLSKLDSRPLSSPIFSLFPVTILLYGPQWFHHTRLLTFSIFFWPVSDDCIWFLLLFWPVIICVPHLLEMLSLLIMPKM